MFYSQNDSVDLNQYDIKLNNLSSIEDIETINCKIKLVDESFCSFGPELENKLLMIGNDFGPGTSYVDLKDFQKKSNVIYNKSIISDKIHDKDYYINHMKDHYMNNIQDDNDNDLFEIEAKKNGFCSRKKKNKSVMDIIQKEIMKIDYLKSLKVISSEIVNKKEHNFKLKFLKCKYEKINRTIEPMSEVRFFEQSFPLDSDILLTDKNDRKYCLILGDLSRFKNVVNFVFDKEDKSYNYRVEEKCSEMPNKEWFYKQIEYYFKWLNSQNDKKARELCNHLELSVKKDEKVFDLQKSNALISNTSQNKKYIYKICKNAQTNIKTRPYFRKVVKYNVANGFPSLTKQSMNQKFADIINYTPTFQDGMQGLSFFLCFQSKDWLQIHLESLKKKFIKTVFEKSKPDVEMNIECLKNTEGKLVSKKLNIWHQGWIENGEYYSEYFLCFL